VRGYKEEGTTTTPFDMAVMNDLDRYHLVQDVVDRLPHFADRAAYIRQAMRDRLIEHKAHVTTYGEDLPAIRDWVWPE
jgi:xylulose-5-phosphate/fructose-6-phosphate phosphoketolase